MMSPLPRPNVARIGIGTSVYRFCKAIPILGHIFPLASSHRARFRRGRVPSFRSTGIVLSSRSDAALPTHGNGCLASLVPCLTTEVLAWFERSS